MEFKELSSLQKLYLNYNPGIDIKQVWRILSNLPKLEELIFYGNNIKLLPERQNVFKRLKSLHLGDESLDLKLVLNSLGSLPRLERLYIDKVNTIPKEINSLKQLKTLVLVLEVTTAEDRKIIFENLRGNRSLKLLQVYGKKFTSLPKEVGSLVQLDTMLLRGNDIKTVPNEIKNLQNLKLLDVSSNDFSDQEKARIKKLLPNTEIKF
ncbi:hypothetical protein [uncultured Microscilla sp.]|uniref:leucine-rich repeat domain-containing protein n=1 Tax=uncultured Microscilla sp. TaxID=432653 RepID=UPI0026088E17|nr:hypothetical protein [uncultured Microscilla sp.]